MRYKIAVMLLIGLVLAFSVQALEVSLYDVEKVDVSLAVTSGSVGSPASCMHFNNQCYVVNSEDGVLMNCYPNEDQTVCHCEFWSCGVGNDCVPNEQHCVGGGYPNGAECPYPGTFTYYCDSGVCNYNSKCGVSPECGSINGKAYMSGGQVGTLSNCVSTSDSLVCECNFVYEQVPLAIVKDEGGLPIEGEEILLPDAVVTKYEISFWEKIVRLIKGEPLKAITGVSMRGWLTLMDKVQFRMGAILDVPTGVVGTLWKHKIKWIMSPYPDFSSKNKAWVSYATVLLPGTQDIDSGLMFIEGALHSDPAYCGKDMYFTAEHYICDVSSGNCILDPTRLSIVQKKLIYSWNCPVTCEDECTNGETGCFSGGTEWGSCWDSDNDGCTEWNYQDVTLSLGNCYSSSKMKVCTNGVQYSIKCENGDLRCITTTCSSGYCNGDSCGECSDTCASLGYECGLANVCNEQVNCGNCPGTMVCQNNKCKVVDTHKECQGGSCVSVSGAGADQCNVDLDCSSTHKECQGGSCVSVSGAGADTCSTDGDCTQTHLECKEGWCVPVPGAGADQCATSNDCQTRHKGCVDGVCSWVEGEGEDKCTTIGEKCGVDYKTILAVIAVLGVGGGLTYLAIPKKKKRKGRRK